MDRYIYIFFAATPQIRFFIADLVVTFNPMINTAQYLLTLKG